MQTAEPMSHRFKISQNPQDQCSNTDGNMPACNTHIIFHMQKAHLGPIRNQGRTGVGTID